MGNPTLAKDCFSTNFVFKQSENGWARRSDSFKDQKVKEAIFTEILRQMTDETFKSRDTEEMFAHMLDVHYPLNYDTHEGSVLPEEFNINPDQPEFFKLLTRIDRIYYDLPRFLRDDQHAMHRFGHILSGISLRRRTEQGITDEAHGIKNGPQLRYFVRFIDQLRWASINRPPVQEALRCIMGFSPIKDFIEICQNLATGRWTIYGTRTSNNTKNSRKTIKFARP